MTDSNKQISNTEKFDRQPRSASPTPNPPGSTSIEILKQGKQWEKQIYKSIGEVSVFSSEFIRAYQPLLLALGALSIAAFAIFLLGGLLDTIDDIPFLKPILQLIGLGYILWLVFRYFLGADRRAKTVADLKKVVNNSIDKFQGKN